MTAHAATGHPLRIGILRLLDCAPVIVAQAHGFFAEAGLDVSIAIEPSWANIADKLAYGLIDAAVMLGPLTVAMAVGLRGRATALRLAATISRDGNAIVLAQGIADELNLAAALRGRELPRFAVVHAYSSHDLLLRDWLNARGMAPDQAELIVLPPADMAAALARADIAGFCVGAPWGALAGHDGVGRIVATSADIAPGHPEKLLVVRGEVADAAPMLVSALRDAIGAATALCGMPGEIEGLARLLARREHLDLPWERLAGALAAVPGNPVFMTGVALRPSTEDLRWSIGRMARAGQLSGEDGTRAEGILLGPGA